MHEDVVGLQHAVRLQLAAPVSIGVLQAKQPALRAFNARADQIQAKVHPSKARLRWLIQALRIA